MYFCISLSMLAFVSLALLARCSPLVAGLPVCSLLTVSEVSEVLTARSRRAIVAAGLAAVEGATTAAAAREPVVAAAWAVWNDQQSSEARCGHTDRRCSEVPPIMQVDEICHARERWSFPQAKGRDGILKSKQGQRAFVPQESRNRYPLAAVLPPHDRREGVAAQTPNAG